MKRICSHLTSQQIFHLGAILPSRDVDGPSLPRTEAHLGIMRRCQQVAIGPRKRGPRCFYVFSNFFNSPGRRKVGGSSHNGQTADRQNHGDNRRVSNVEMPYLSHMETSGECSGSQTAVMAIVDWGASAIRPPASIRDRLPHSFP